LVRRPGRLDVVATPIGNLADLSPRAREALAAADVVAAEDTRHTGQLLAALGIARPLVSLHEHNEAGRIESLLERLARGEVIALASDAGTPLISDPGAQLVARAVAAGFAVRPIPGPSAVIAALSVSGLATERFAFEGFLPARAAERRTRLAALAAEPRTLVLFEAPHRIRATLDDLLEVFGGTRRAAVARELTKAFETVYRGSLAELVAQAAAEPNLERGEITLVIEGATPAMPVAHDAALLEKVVGLLARELPPGRAAAIAAQITGAPRSAAYALAVARSRSQGDDVGETDGKG
jgi:16S rRNA (cytidine1402-2'-O)-methyltransferase